MRGSPPEESERWGPESSTVLLDSELLLGSTRKGDWDLGLLAERDAGWLEPIVVVVVVVVIVGSEAPEVAGVGTVVALAGGQTVGRAERATGWGGPLLW